MWAFGLAAVWLAADQATKYLVQASMAQNQSIPVAGHLLRITYIHNPSAAFGLDLGSIGFYIIFSVAASVAVSWYIVRLPRKEYWPRIALALILAGAVGNLIDRVRLGEVVDFIQVGLSQRLTWPIFNVADIGVSAGVTLLILYFLVVGEPEEADEPAD
ncbi:MAG: signal peptidase II [bacterium]